MNVPKSYLYSEWCRVFLVYRVNKYEILFIFQLDGCRTNEQKRSQKFRLNKRILFRGRKQKYDYRETNSKDGEDDDNEANIFGTDNPPIEAEVATQKPNIRSRKLTRKLSRKISMGSKVNRRKFNYEKYVKFLELTLESIGFCLARVTLTWDRVSFYLMLLATLVGVFGQSAVLQLKDVMANQ